MSKAALNDDPDENTPNFRVPPRLQDYSEIFGGFRGTSIPVLDIPALHEAEVWLDVKDFSYKEVFTDFNGLDLMASYDCHLIDQSYSGDESSFEAWTPAETEYLSQESDYSPHSARSKSLLSEDFQQLLDKNQLNDEDMLNGMHIIQLHPVPGPIVVDDEVNPWKEGFESPSFQENEDIFVSRDSSEGNTEESYSGETERSKKKLELGSDDKIAKQNADVQECDREGRASFEAFKQQEESDWKTRAATDATKGDDFENNLMPAKEAYWQEAHVAQEVHKQKENEKKLRANRHEEFDINLDIADEWKELDVLAEIPTGEIDMEVKVAVKQNKNEQKLKGVDETVENEVRLEKSEDGVNDDKMQEISERGEDVRLLKESIQTVNSNKQMNQPLEKEENTKVLEQAEFEEVANEGKENEKRVKKNYELEEEENIIEEALDQEESDKTLGMSTEKKETERKEEAREREHCEKRLREAHEREEFGKRSKEACEPGEEEQEDEIQHEEISKQASEREESTKRLALAGEEELKGLQAHENTRTTDQRKENLSQENYVDIREDNLKPSDEVYELAGKKNIHSSQAAFGEDGAKLEETQVVTSVEESIEIMFERDFKKEEDMLKEGITVAADRFMGTSQGSLQHDENQISAEYATKLSENETVSNSDEARFGIHNNLKGSEMVSDSTLVDGKLTNERGDSGESTEQDRVFFDHDVNKDEVRLFKMVNEGVENHKKFDPAESYMSKKRGQTRKATSPGTEIKKKNVNEPLFPEDTEKEEKMKKNREMEEYLRKMEEKREREREREKDRMDFEKIEREREREKDKMDFNRATREVHERAYVDVYETAERATVERANAEAQKRTLAEARVRLEKACAEAKENSLSEKQGRKRVDNSESYSNSRYSRSFGYGASYDAEKSEGIESAQRSKARLGRHRRTAERVAKALAEKNMRDLLAHREQIERDRLAGSLDADINKWSSGKERNLRALVSTLQYILGPDSGWQPIPLTDVSTSAAVKKAYRKATLCVHPDKLQQRGADIRQKYICEKVFDLLKEAWNNFILEEQ